MPDAHEYEEKYGFPPGYSRLLFVCTAFVFSGLLLALPLALRIVEVVVFGGAGLVLLVLGLRATRLAALRVDEHGLTLGGAPSRYSSTTQLLPWNELRAVHLSRQAQMPRLPVITAIRRGNREPASKPVQGWRIDPDKLRHALTAFASGVRLTDER